MRSLSRTLVMCFSVVAFPSPAMAQLPQADIIVALDTSGSMQNEMNQFIGSLNSLINGIQQSGVDVHLILIAGYSACVPPPLGSGNCPDENLPLYRHVVDSVDNNNALAKIIERFPQYSGSLRAGAKKFVTVISDDESDMSTSTFHLQFLALDADLSGYVFNAIVAGPLSSCGAAFGRRYYDLAAMTGGIRGDLCQPNGMSLALSEMITQVDQLVANADNLPPIANAGDDQILIGCAGCTTTVLLDGSASFDADEGALQYAWANVTSGALPLNSTSPTATIALGLGVHRFQLTVTDTGGHSSSDEVIIDIRAVPTVTGPPGPIGPQGETGPAGQQGAQGPAGSDANVLPGTAILRPLSGPNAVAPAPPASYALMGNFKLEKPTGESKWFAVYVKIE